MNVKFTYGFISDRKLKNNYYFHIQEETDQSQPQ